MLLCSLACLFVEPVFLEVKRVGLEKHVSVLPFGGPKVFWETALLHGGVLLHRVAYKLKKALDVWRSRSDRLLNLET